MGPFTIAGWLWRAPGFFVFLAGLRDGLLWGRRVLGTAGAVLAVLIFTMIPTVLAHAGLATTDMGMTAWFAAATYALVRLAEDPGPKTAAWLGLSAA